MPIKLNDFCGHTGYYDLTRPFVRNGKEFATDGSILVFRTTRKRDSACHCPPLDRLLIAHGKATCTERWPHDPSLRKRRFPSEEGTEVQIANRWIAMEYHKLILQLSNVTFDPRGEASDNICFRSDTFNGILCPISYV